MAKDGMFNLIERKNLLVDKSWNESKKMWHIAGPAILAGVCQFSIGLVTVAFVGHLGDTELAAVSAVQNVIEGFVSGFMLGMGSALETLCGQAVGAGQFNMLGVYLQRSCIITVVTALILVPFYVFASPILKSLHQGKEISELSGKFARWVIPQLFAYAINFPIQKFLQSQGKGWVMTIISMIVLAFHALMNWVVVVKLGYGMLGAAIVGDISWWLLILAQIIYVVSGYFPDAWTGFSSLAFKNLYGFVKLSLASAVMLCLEMWYFTAIIILVGCLKNPEIAVDAMSICMNLELWAVMVALGFNAAVSVRVSNELGAGNPKAAKFSVGVAVCTAALFGIVFMIAVLATKDNFPKLFTTEPIVCTRHLSLGVAVGAGWQSMVAFINVVCYYVFGLPIGAILGYKFNLGVQGIWTGMIVGCLLQTVVLFIVMIKANWQKEALQAEERIRTWGGNAESDRIDYNSSMRPIVLQNY
ncbi:hypothetical protein C5167_013990 [Papaver somniferum]|uniref:Protein DETOXIFICATION n=1 Tax=Papaver somniferum TaxID=3469 RepID=A0A4Y7J664_PAPSO|nr:hypothetical protein C5167_013990 [Papaver somniferum]